MTRRQLAQIALGALSILVLVLAWWFFAPQQLGGRSTYATAYGTSMEPQLERGDLVVTRQQGDYRVGDVVAYRSRQLGRLVIHRIVAIHGDRYTFKGDANDFVDSERPTRGQLVGALWLAVPVAGDVLQWVRVPRNAAILAAAIVLGLLLTGSGVAYRRGGRGRRAAMRGAGPATRGPLVPGWVHVTRAVLGVALGFFALLGLLAFAWGATREVDAGALYRQDGVFSYAIAVPESPFYDGRTVATGDAVFTEIVGQLPLSFGYRFASPLPSHVTTTGTLAVRVSDGFGWVRTVMLVHGEAAGGRLSLDGVLDLGELRATVRAFERAVGKRGDAYRVTVVPRVLVSGTVDGQRVDRVFSPSLEFVLDSTRLVVAPPGPGDAPQDLTPSSSTRHVKVEPRTLALASQHLEVSALRALAIVGAALSLLGLCLVTVVVARTRRGATLALEERYAAMLVGATSVERRVPETIVEVRTFEALVRIATRYDRMILRLRLDDGSPVYLVEDDRVVYRFAAAVAPGGAARALPIAPVPL